MSYCKNVTRRSETYYKGSQRIFFFSRHVWPTFMFWCSDHGYCSLLLSHYQMYSIRLDTCFRQEHTLWLYFCWSYILKFLLHAVQILLTPKLPSIDSVHVRHERAWCFQWCLIGTKPVSDPAFAPKGRKLQISGYWAKIWKINLFTHFLRTLLPVK